MTMVAGVMPCFLQSAALVQHIYCSAIISKKMCDALTSYVFSVSAAKGGIDEFGGLPRHWRGAHPGSDMELYTFFKARPERTTIYNMSSVDFAGVLFFLVLREPVRRARLQLHGASDQVLEGDAAQVVQLPARAAVQLPRHGGLPVP